MTADEQYLRDSILLPNKQIAAGYQPIMPTFQGQISEEELNAIIAYLKSLGNQPEEEDTVSAATLQAPGQPIAHDQRKLFERAADDCAPGYSRRITSGSRSSTWSRLRFSSSSAARRRH